MRFRDRADAGVQLADQLRLREFHDPVVLALPRGGVPVAFEIAAALGAPLDVFVARKVSAPRQPEYGIGAVAEGGAVIATDAVASLGNSEADFGRLVLQEQRELDRRVERYRDDRPLPAIAGRDVVLVDDGLATGVTAEAALQSLRGLAPRRLVLAVPACAPGTRGTARGHRRRRGVRHVAAVLPGRRAVVPTVRPNQRRRGPRPARPGRRDAPMTTTRLDTVWVPQADGAEVAGDLTVPAGATGLVAFAHGSGSSRLSPRNQLVAGAAAPAGPGHAAARPRDQRRSGR